MSLNIRNLRNIGIAAHIDAGKTTLTERFLLYAGKIHRAGDVDQGTTTTDYLQQEQERGITITSAAVPLSWNRNGIEHPINLIDTPGHVDFTIEVERSLRVLDGAVIVFSAVEGVQAQSETVWRQANRYRVPRLAFINKLDRMGADFARTFASMCARLKGANCIAVQLPIGAESNFVGIVDLVAMKFRRFTGEGQNSGFVDEPVPAEHAEAAAAARAQLLEKVAEMDDSIMERFLAEQPITEGDLRAAIRRGTLALTCQPVFCGSAFKFRGVQALIDGVCDYLPSPLDRPPETGVDPKNREKKIVCHADPKEPLAAVAFKIIAKKTGDLTFLRLYSGTLRSGTRLTNPLRDKKENVSRLLKMFADEELNLDEATAGDIVAVIGLKDTITGDTLCDARRPVLLGRIDFPATVVAKTVEPESSDDKNKLLDALARMSREDPTFHWSANPETGEVIMRGMGELHLTILTERLSRPPPVGLGLAVRVGRPKVSYRETVSTVGEARHEFNRVIGGKNQFAAVAVRIEPMSEATGEQAVVFRAGGVPEKLSGKLTREFLGAIRQGVEESARTGIVAGYPLVNAVVTLTDADVSETDSTEVAFSQAAFLAVNAAAQAAGPLVLEPFMRLEISTPEQYVGAIQGDLNRRGAEIASVESRGEQTIIEAYAPLSELFGYEDDLRGKSQGRAASTMEFARYAPAMGGAR